jgi:small subunit ribosomal protein S11
MSADKEQEKKEEIQEAPAKDSVIVDKPVKKEDVSAKKEDEKKTDELIDDKSVSESTTSSAKKKRKVRRQVQRGRAYIRSTYNNTMITLTDLHGNGLAWSSAGLLGFKGAKKATTYAANQVVLDVAEKVAKFGLNDLEIYVKGVGSGREAAIRGLAQKGFNLTLIKDKTPIPHNGCRPRKPRRV